MRQLKVDIVVFIFLDSYSSNYASNSIYNVLLKATFHFTLLAVKCLLGNEVYEKC